MMNPQDLVALMQNPISFAISRGFNLPSDMQFDGPKDITMYLINSGQVKNQDALNKGQQVAQQFGYKI